jgi:DNA-binding MarR family transcriptional regulator
MLSERLRELEAEGIVVRAVIPESPVRVEYALTEKGRALESAIVAIAEWAERWVSAQTSAPESDASQLATIAPDKKRAAAVSPRSRRSKKDGRRKVGGAARI